MPEKPIHEIPRSIRDNFDRGMAAYQKGNFDYAITLFTDVLEKEPAFYDCREALRAAQFRRGGKRPGMFRRFLSQASPTLAKGQIALRTGNPAAALHLAELALNDDPSSPAAHELLARAALTLALPRTAVLSLDIIFKNQPDDRDIAIKLAQALVAAGQSKRADKIYADLLANHPNDIAIARAYKDLGAQRTLDSASYAPLADGSGSYRDALHNKDEAVALEQQNRQVKADDHLDNLVANARARVAAEPDNLKHLRTLADLFAQQRNYPQALACYQQIAQAEGGSDPALDKTISDIRLLQIDQQIAELDPADPVAAARRDQLVRERAEGELTACKARVDRFPTDLALRFELGRLHVRAGRHAEAIPELQRAQSHPHHRLPALSLLAQCFTRRGMHDLALRSLQTALREKPVFDEEKKELLYDLGVVLENLSRHDEAIEQFKAVYEQDVTYRDVAARVDAHYAARSQPPS